MTKEKQKAVFEFIFSHRNYDTWIASAFCNESGVPNANQFGVPFPFSLSEARSVLVLLKEKGLMVEVGDIFGEPLYTMHQTKDSEWAELIANSREICWLERHRWTIWKTVGAFILFSASLVYTTVLQKTTEHKIDEIYKAMPQNQPTNSFHHSYGTNAQATHKK